MMNGLLRSRKFWLASFGVVQAVVLQYLDVPDPVWQSITALVAVLITTIAVEDGMDKGRAERKETERVRVAGRAEDASK